ncbi:MAG TPA: DUF2147 domain-containing protein [Edaphocola sp.]|nr:DUF2147 domain-containing protein [Edaphocola sp.]
MKKLGIAIFIILFNLFAFVAQGQDIRGYWLNDVKEAKVEIYQASNGKYYGKIIWLKEPNRNGKPKVDIHNVKESLRTRPIMGLVLLSGFEKKSNTYENGTIYDPKNGKTYSCKITPEGNDKLNIRGFIGISLLGRTTVWTRTTN